MRPLRKILSCVLLTMTCAMSYAQIGIGTTTPDASSILDIQSSTQGMLPPRMTTTQRTAIASPANGLMVFDTTLGSLYHYDTATTSWIKLSGDKEGRLKYKLIKSTDVLATVLAAEKIAGGNTKYLLDTTTLYEMNGTIMLDLPIELNNSYFTGHDPGEDRLIKYSGDMFVGATGGTVKGLALIAPGGNVFNIIGTGAIGAQTETFGAMDCSIANSLSVGKIENCGMAFMSLVSYAGNTNGIVYKDINRLLLSSTVWLSTNSGTYEKLQGTFGLVAKIGGFAEVTDAKIGFDVSSNPIITADAVMESIVFTGALTTGKYVNPYTTGTYPGFSFTNSWSVRSTNIPNEFDAEATGTFYLNRAGTAQADTPIGTMGVNVKLDITAGLAGNLFRCTTTANNRITYLGKKGRFFTVRAAVAFDVVAGSNNTEYAFFFVRIPAGGGTVPQVASEAVIDTNAGYVQSFPIQGAIYLNSGDSVELWIRRLNSGGQSFRVKSFSMIAD